MSRSLSLLLGACVGVLAIGACSQQEPPAPPAAPAADPLPIPVATAPMAAVEPPAESSLSLKRGLLSLAMEHTTFKPCGEDTPLWVIDQSDGMLNETFANEARPLELYVEAHGERTPVPTGMAAARGYRGAFVLEEVLYATPDRSPSAASAGAQERPPDRSPSAAGAGAQERPPDRSPSAAGAGAQERPPGESSACSEPAPAYTVLARGNEPFWSIEVAAGKLIWRQPEAPQELVIEALEVGDAEGAVGYSGAAEDHTLELFVEAEPCRDTMSGAYFAYGARATFDGKALKGCARIGE